MDRYDPKEPVEITVARLWEISNSQSRELNTIRGGVERIEERLSRHLPCSENNRRLDTLEKDFRDIVKDDHEKRIQAVKSSQDKWSGKMIILGSGLFIIATAVASWVVILATQIPSS